MHYLAQMKCFRPIIGVMVSASLSACHSVGASRAENPSIQQKTILGTWNCVFSAGQKTIPTDQFRYTFSRNNTLTSDLQIGVKQVVTRGTWRIDQASTLVFPGKKDITTRNLKTGDVSNGRIGKTTIFEIVDLTSNRLVFSAKEGNKVASCRR